ncbi:MAG TPA: tetratricopeptide repeat protein [Thermoplasmata archaeon]|nr:tetratricopeptide repeat protein [Thermoplasmata archaeon]
MVEEGPGTAPVDPSSAARLPAGLTAEEHRILAYASAIGSDFDFALLVRAMEAQEEQLAEELEHLVHRGILRERRGGERFGFSEEEFRARVYRSLTESRLRVLHRKIALAMESLGTTPPAEQAAELGRHYFLGKVSDKSLAYNQKAAEEARSVGEPERAVHHLERVLLELEHLPGDHRREQGEVLQSLGDLVFSVGNFPAADAYYHRALERVGPSQPNLTARLTLARAEIAREDLDGEAATRGALEARRLFEMTGDPVGVAQTHRLMARVAFARGDYTESLDENICALELLEGNRAPHLMGLLSIDLGNSFALSGEECRPVAVDWYKHAIELLSETGDWVELSRAYHNLGVAVGESRPQDGLEYLARSREAAERAHDRRSAGWSLLSGVEMRLSLGQLDEATRDVEQAARTFEHLSDRLGLEQVDLNRGEIAERRGQWDDAEKAYQAAIAQCRSFGLDADESEVQFHLARLRTKTRDWEGARAAFETAERLGLPKLRPNLLAGFEQVRQALRAAGPPGARVPTEDAVTSDHPPL